MRPSLCQPAEGAAAIARVTGRRPVGFRAPGYTVSDPLFDALEAFKRLDISMSKIESRPSRRKAWEYFFFVDVDGHADDPRTVEALEELQKHCTRVKVLGSYPMA